MGYDITSDYRGYDLIKVLRTFIKGTNLVGSIVLTYLGWLMFVIVTIYYGSFYFLYLSCLLIHPSHIS